MIYPIYPEGYKSKLSQRETQYAIKTVKDTFQFKLSKALNLDRERHRSSRVWPSGNATRSGTTDTKPARASIPI